MKKHVGRTDQQLKDRLKNEPNVPTASTFPDRATAESAVSKVIDDNQSKISDFLKGKDNQIVVIEKASEPVGTSWKRGAKAAVPGTEIYLIIRKDKKMPTGYRIHTGYPNP